MRITFTAISEKEWIEKDKGFPEYLCQLPYNVSEAEKKLHLKFLKYEEIGLGTLFSCYVKLSGKKFWFRGFGDKEQKVEPVAVYVRNEDEKTATNLSCLLSFLSINQEDLVEINDVSKNRNRHT